MPLVSEQLPNLMNGVSQQAYTMRLPSQAVRQVNGFSSVVEGVNKRLPLKYLAKIIEGKANKAYVHTINRDVSERYVVMIFNGSIKVFDLQGNEKTVAYPDGKGYINAQNPQNVFRCVTLADSTFVVNTEKKVAKSSKKSFTPPAQGVVFIKAVNYDITYTVKIDGAVKATHKTADAYGTKPKVSIGGVVDALVASLKSSLGSGWDVVGEGPTVNIARKDGAEFELDVEDSNGSTMSRAIYDEVQRFTDLPVVCRNNFVVRVIGTEGQSNDDYWLKFRTDSGNQFGAGVWEETVAPDVDVGFDPASMPHQLIRKSNGSFELRRVTWGEREAGNEESSPWPSFVGKTIRDIYYDRKRLCLLSDTNVIMSRAGDFFSYFRRTVVSLLDDDPIDVSASGSKVSILQYAVPFNKNVVIFSGQSQFVIEDKALLASKPPAIKEINAYEIDAGAKPVAVGKTVFFPLRRGAYSSLMEYFIIPETETTDASDVSKHVPTYIPRDIFRLAASTTTDVVLSLNRGNRNRVYVYKYYWAGDQKLQSSHSYFEFREDAEVLGAEFIGDIAYMVVQYNDGVYLETLEMNEGVTDENQGFVTRLDRRVNETHTSTTYDQIADRTTYTLPYTPTNNIMVVTRPEDTPRKGDTAYVTADVVNVSGKTVTVKGDFRHRKVYIGERYSFVYEFSPPVLKTASQTGGSATVGAGRLQLLRWYLMYANTGYFRAEVKSQHRNKYSYVFAGKVLGTSSAKVGEVEMSSGVFPFRVNGKSDRTSITIINDSFLPSYLIGAEWEGRYDRRTSRI
ncbi:hypothetical protein ACQU0X_08500 [Pseudovibrio ascidiaceicola]|uniref:phage nozzle protein n=1 Tax=Pseudovibrio ascidiaceicola TaxID=285279 RepID=UPI003D359BAE